MKKRLKKIIYLCLAFFTAFCGCSTIKASNVSALDAYNILNVYAHDPNAQTEGLIYMDGFLYEGTGPCLNGPSSLRKVEIETGKILQIRELPESLFGEGITIFDDRIIQLTYTSQTGFVYDRETFDLLDEFHLPTKEGWGLTYDGSHLIMSDGTATLHYLDPLTFKDVKQLQVRDDRGPVYNLNELEFINGKVYVNIFETPIILCISPETGRITGSIDLSILLKERFKDPELVNRANGIAHDPATGRLFITGKYWPYIFEIGIILVN